MNKWASENSEMLFDCGMELINVGKYDDAVNYIKRAIDLGSQPRYYNGLGRAYSYCAATKNENDPDKRHLLCEAERCIQMAFEASGKHTVDTYHDLAWIYDEQKEYAKAVNWYELAIGMLEYSENSENDRSYVYHNYACSLSKLNGDLNLKKALNALGTLLMDPWRDDIWISIVKNDVDLDNLRTSNETKELFFDLIDRAERLKMV